MYPEARPVRLSVDYGTSHTVAMWESERGAPRPVLFDGTPLLPSAVLADADGRVAAGVDATRGARLNPAGYEPHPKRRIDDLEVLLGGRPYSVVDLVAATLRRVALEAKRVAGPISELVMTCPVAWGPARRAVLTEAATQVGLPAPAFVAEPVAAATYFAQVLHQVPPGSCLIVYDLGGGTFDVCVIRYGPNGFEPLAYRGLDDFGGADLDALVIARVGAAVTTDAPEQWRRLTEARQNSERRQLQALWDDARHIKEALSRQPQASLYVPVVEREVHVTREEFEQAARPVLERTVQVTMATLREARVPPGEVAGLYLVGGATRTPLVATLLHQGSGIAPTVLEQPETVVAEGALRVGATPSQSHPLVSAPPRVSAPAVAVTAASVPAPTRPLSPPVPSYPGPGPAVSPIPMVAQQPVRRPRPVAVLLGPVVGALLGVLTAAAPAGAPLEIQQALNLPVKALVQCLVLPVLAANIAIPLFGWLGRTALKACAVAGLVALAVGSFLTAVAGDGDALILAHLLGCLGAGALIGLSWQLIAWVGGQAARARAVFAVLATALGLASPWIGKALASNFGWRSIFIPAVPLALAALIGAAIAVPSKRVLASEETRIPASGTVSGRV